MFERILEALLLKLFGDYIEDLDKESLKVGVLSLFEKNLSTLF